MMHLPSMRRGQRGLSLIELGVVLLIMGILGIIVWRWVAATREPMNRTAIMGQLAQAQAAVEGFVLAKHRLPCAASSTNGNEDCGNTSAAAVLLPWRTLGLSSRLGQLHYGVNRGGGVDLAAVPAASPLVTPDLNRDYSAIPVLSTSSDVTTDAAATATVTDAAANASAAIAAALARRPIANGLDWCRGLRQLAANTGAAGVLTAGNLSANMPVAFVLAHPGVNGVFEGNNVVGGAGGWRFDFPDRAQDHGYDDMELAVGPGDLASRIGCVSHLSAMQAEAQGAYTAYDNARVAQEYWSLRVFDIAQNLSGVESANTAVILAAMNLALAAANVALSVASAADTEGITIFGIALAAADAVAAGVEVGFAAAELAKVKQELIDSRAKELALRAYMAHLYETFSQSLNAAVLLDQKGLNP